MALMEPIVGCGHKKGGRIELAPTPRLSTVAEENERSVFASLYRLVVWASDAPHHW